MSPAEPVEIHAWAGGQADSDGHGDVTVGVRHGPWRADLYTDTLELAWEPAGDAGRAWVKARANAFSAGLMISPWTDGAPDPSRAAWAAYAGGELGALRYLPAGAYLGARVGVWAWDVRPQADTTAPVPEDAVIGAGEVVGGVWREGLDVVLTVGGDAEPDGLAPRAQLHAEAHGEGLVAPRFGVNAGVAEGQGALTRTRLGGLTPYVVPMAGAAWGEWWVEDYVAARAWLVAGPPSVRGGVLVDAAWFDGRSAAGFAATAEGRWRRAYGDLKVGWAPWIPRQEGVSRVSVFFRIGLDWAPVRGRGAG